MPTARRAACVAAAVASVVASVGLAGCAERPPLPERLTLRATSFAALEGWAGDRQSEALGALVRSCRKRAISPDPAATRAEPPDGGPAGGFGAAADWQAACAAAETVPSDGDGAARAFFETWFVPYLAANNGNTDGLFTGYFEPELRGSRTKSARYRVPLYRVPDDLVTADLGLFREQLKGIRIVGRVENGALRPYDSRSDIDGGSLSGRGWELLYVDDAVDAFFLHIQGSGRVSLDDGSVMQVGYAGTNGRRYVALGAELVARGALPKDEVSMQSIRAWLGAHPDEAAKMMETNSSYVFFRELKGEGPIGAEGTVLTPGRSLAIDPRFVAFGIPVWLETRDPLDSNRPLARLLIAQDTGGAIKGPVRGDVFWGPGKDAAERAGRMKAQGRYYLLLPKPAAVASGR
jgi:membrane-bound lytic murein transglycosylase A